MATDTLYVEQPILVEALRGFREIDDADAQRVVAAVRGLKSGTITAAHLTAAVETATFRDLIDSAPGEG